MRPAYEVAGPALCGKAVGRSRSHLSIWRRGAAAMGMKNSLCRSCDIATPTQSKKASDTTRSTEEQRQRRLHPQRESRARCRASVPRTTWERRRKVRERPPTQRTHPRHPSDRNHQRCRRSVPWPEKSTLWKRRKILCSRECRSSARTHTQRRLVVAVRRVPQRRRCRPPRAAAARWVRRCRAHHLPRT
jgi:hypothetical protein